MNDLNLQPNTDFASPTAKETNPFKADPVTETNSKNLGITGLVGVVLIILVTILGGYKLYQQNQISKKIEAADQLIEQQKNQALPEGNKKVEDSYKKTFLDSKKEKQLYWTNVINRINESIPDPKVINIESISGSEEGSISLTARTTTESLSPYLDTAILIESLKAKSFFENVFVPSISSSINEQGQEFLSYNLNFEYKKDSSDKNLTTAVKVPTNTKPAASDLSSRIEALRAQATQPQTNTPQ